MKRTASSATAASKHASPPSSRGAPKFTFSKEVPTPRAGEGGEGRNPADNNERLSPTTVRTARDACDDDYGAARGAAAAANKSLADEREGPDDGAALPVSPSNNPSSSSPLNAKSPGTATDATPNAANIAYAVGDPRLDAEMRKAGLPNLMIVDPEHNNERVKLDEDDHSLTNKDLVILGMDQLNTRFHCTSGGGGTGSYGAGLGPSPKSGTTGADTDGLSATSSLTEPTYHDRHGILRAAMSEKFLPTLDHALEDNGADCARIDATAKIGGVAGGAVSDLTYFMREAYGAAVSGLDTAVSAIRRGTGTAASTSATNVMASASAEVRPLTQHGAASQTAGHTSRAAATAAAVATTSANVGASNGTHPREERAVYVTRVYHASTREMQDAAFVTAKRLRDRASNQKSTGHPIADSAVQCATDGLNACAPEYNVTGLRSTWNNPRLTHDLGVQFKEGEDGRAHVWNVASGSGAEVAGVRRGDIVSFAMALNNVNPTNARDLAVARQLGRKLETVGMRTSYRQLFEMFLARTVSGSPVAMVFRREPLLHSTIANEHIGSALLGLPTCGGGGPMDLDCYRFSDFLRDGLTLLREAEFERDDEHLPGGGGIGGSDASGAHEVVRGNIEYFLPRPRSYARVALDGDGDGGPQDGGRRKKGDKQREEPPEPLRGAVDVRETVACAPCIPTSDAAGGVPGAHSLGPENLTSMALRDMVAGSAGVVFFRCARLAFGVATVLSGSGVVISRASDTATAAGGGADGGGAAAGGAAASSSSSTWSAPCAVGLSGLGVGPQVGAGVTDYAVFVKSRLAMRKFHRDGHINLAGSVAGAMLDGYGTEFCGIAPGSSTGSDFAAIGRSHGAFVGVSLLGCKVYIRDEANEKMYQNSAADGKTPSAAEILSGGVLPPESARDLFCALRRLEFPYSMNPHPLPPDCLRRYALSDWHVRDSCRPAPSLGTTAASVASSLPEPNEASKKNLRQFLSNLFSADPRAVEDRVDVEVFGRKFRQFLLDGVPVKYVDPAADLVRQEPRMLCLWASPPGVTPRETRIRFKKQETSKGAVAADKGGAGADGKSQYDKKKEDYTINLGEIICVHQKPPASLQLRSRDARRFVFLESDLSNFGGSRMFLAKNEKDALLLLCGLKFLLEKNRGAH